MLRRLTLEVVGGDVFSVLVPHNLTLAGLGSPRGTLGRADESTFGHKLASVARMKVLRRDVRGRKREVEPEEGSDRDDVDDACDARFTVIIL